MALEDVAQELEQLAKSNFDRIEVRKRLFFLLVSVTELSSSSSSRSEIISIQSRVEKSLLLILGKVHSTTYSDVLLNQIANGFCAIINHGDNRPSKELFANIVSMACNESEKNSSKKYHYFYIASKLLQSLGIELLSFDSSSKIFSNKSDYLVNYVSKLLKAFNSYTLPEVSIEKSNIRAVIADFVHSLMKSFLPSNHSYVISTKAFLSLQKFLALICSDKSHSVRIIGYRICKSMAQYFTKMQSTHSADYPRPLLEPLLKQSIRGLADTYPEVRLESAICLSSILAECITLNMRGGDTAKPLHAPSSTDINLAEEEEFESSNGISSKNASATDDENWIGEEDIPGDDGRDYGVDEEEDVEAGQVTARETKATGVGKNTIASSASFMQRTASILKRRKTGTNVPIQFTVSSALGWISSLFVNAGAIGSRNGISVFHVRTSLALTGTILLRRLRFLSLDDSELFTSRHIDEVLTTFLDSLRSEKSINTPFIASEVSVCPPEGYHATHLRACVLQVLIEGLSRPLPEKQSSSLKSHSWQLSVYSSCTKLLESCIRENEYNCASMLFDAVTQILTDAVPLKHPKATSYVETLQPIALGALSSSSSTLRYKSIQILHFLCKYSPNTIDATVATCISIAKHHHSVLSDSATRASIAANASNNVAADMQQLSSAHSFLFRATASSAQNSSSLQSSASSFAKKFAGVLKNAASFTQQTLKQQSLQGMPPVSQDATPVMCNYIGWGLAPAVASEGGIGIPGGGPGSGTGVCSGDEAAMLSSLHGHVLAASVLISAASSLATQGSFLNEQSLATFVSRDTLYTAFTFANALFATGKHGMMTSNLSSSSTITFASLVAIASATAEAEINASFARAGFALYSSLSTLGSRFLSINEIWSSMYSNLAKELISFRTFFDSFGIGTTHAGSGIYLLAPLGVPKAVQAASNIFTPTISSKQQLVESLSSSEQDAILLRSYYLGVANAWKLSSYSASCNFLSQICSAVSDSAMSDRVPQSISSSLFRLCSMSLQWLVSSRILPSSIDDVSFRRHGRNNVIEAASAACQVRWNENDLISSTSDSFGISDAQVSTIAGVSLSAVAFSRQSVLNAADRTLSAISVLPCKIEAAGFTRGLALSSALAMLSNGYLSLNTLELGLLSSGGEPSALSNPELEREISKILTISQTSVDSWSPLLVAIGDNMFLNQTIESRVAKAMNPSDQGVSVDVLASFSAFETPYKSELKLTQFSVPPTSSTSASSWDHPLDRFSLLQAFMPGKSTSDLCPFVDPRKSTLEENCGLVIANSLPFLPPAKVEMILTAIVCFLRPLHAFQLSSAPGSGFRVSEQLPSTSVLHDIMKRMSDALALILRTISTRFENNEFASSKLFSLSRSSLGFGIQASSASVRSACAAALCELVFTASPSTSAEIVLSLGQQLNKQNGAMAVTTATMASSEAGSVGAGRQLWQEIASCRFSIAGILETLQYVFNKALEGTLSPTKAQVIKLWCDIEPAVTDTFRDNRFPVKQHSLEAAAAILRAASFSVRMNLDPEKACADKKVLESVVNSFITHLDDCVHQQSHSELDFVGTLKAYTDIMQGFSHKNIVLPKECTRFAITLQGMAVTSNLISDRISPSLVLDGPLGNVPGNGALVDISHLSPQPLASMIQKGYDFGSDSISVLSDSSNAKMSLFNPEKFLSGYGASKHQRTGTDENANVRIYPVFDPNTFDIITTSLHEIRSYSSNDVSNLRSPSKSLPSNKIIAISEIKHSFSLASNGIAAQLVAGAIVSVMQGSISPPNVSSSVESIIAMENRRLACSIISLGESIVDVISLNSFSQCSNSIYATVSSLFGIIMPTDVPLDSHYRLLVLLNRLSECLPDEAMKIQIVSASIMSVFGIKSSSVVKFHSVSSSILSVYTSHLFKLLDVVSKPTSTEHVRSYSVNWFQVSDSLAKLCFIFSKKSLTDVSIQIASYSMVESYRVFMDRLVLGSEMLPKELLPLLLSLQSSCVSLITRARDCIEIEAIPDLILNVLPKKSSLEQSPSSLDKLHSTKLYQLVLLLTARSFFSIQKQVRTISPRQLEKIVECLIGVLTSNLPESESSFDTTKNIPSEESISILFALLELVHSSGGLKEDAVDGSSLVLLPLLFSISSCLFQFIKIYPTSTLLVIPIFLSLHDHGIFVGMASMKKLAKLIVSFCLQETDEINSISRVKAFSYLHYFLESHSEDYDKLISQQDLATVRGYFKKMYQSDDLKYQIWKVAMPSTIAFLHSDGPLLKQSFALVDICDPCRIKSDQPNFATIVALSSL
jgi:hypothetical protein